MFNKVLFATAILIAGSLVGCQVQPPVVAPNPQSQAKSADAKTVEALTARVEALEEQLEAIEKAAGQESEPEKAAESELAFQVVIATYLMDTAGFHDMDVRINEEGEIDPGDAGTVRRIRRILAVTNWPEELESTADKLIGILDDYAAALSDNDVEAAQPLAADAHEVQHELSHAVEAWLTGGHANEHEN